MFAVIARVVWLSSGLLSAQLEIKQEILCLKQILFAGLKHI